MKKTFQLILATLFTSSLAFSQVNVNLEITHTLNSVNSVMNTTSSNNLGDDFKITRLQYYVTKITVLHDGGQSLLISLDTLALINVDNELVTTIPLGNLNVTAVEGVKFNIGVYAPENNNDPSLWPSNHPLAPQNPSMHWGWASGYRFVAFEGTAGTNFSQMWQFHGLGNGNYFEILPVMAGSENVSGTETIKVEANYTKALEDLSISQGLISHGETGDAVTVLENFRDFVFGVAPAASVELNSADQVSVSPNPTSDVVLVNKLVDVEKIELFDATGKLISTTQVSQLNQVQIELPFSGIYFLKIVGANGQVATKKVIKN